MGRYENTQRFTERVTDYVRYRPGYPPAVLDVLREDCGLSEDDVVADVGAGTGKLSRMFLENGNVVYGVEPNREMREAGIRELAGYERFHASGGTAEETGLGDGSVDLISVGQAFHWFDHVGTRREFERVLRPGGWVVIVFNTRDATLSPFLGAYENFVKSNAVYYEKVRQGRHAGNEDIEDFFSPSQVGRSSMSNSQAFDLDGLKGRYFSSSYAPTRSAPLASAAMPELEKLFEEHQKGGYVAFDYRTEVYFGRLQPEGIGFR